MGERILKHCAHDQYIADLALYTVATNLVRALPDARDGLKPVNRRILFTLLNDEGAISPRTQVKSSAVEGTVMKKYHPHSGTYSTFKTMINWFEIKEPLMLGQGSFGTISGEGASANRYTECCLSPFGLECVCGALANNSEVVDWSPTYDNKYSEPQYLPVKVPLLLVNGISGGIGTGIRADLPTHNLGEVIDATLNLIDNPDADVVLIPDHCIACDIIDTDWKSISNKGYGSYRARATMTTSYKGDHPIITITSLPVYGTNNVIQKIEEKISSKIPQIMDITDESKNEYGVRIIIKLKKGSDVNFVKESLFKYTPCEVSQRVNFEVVLGTELIRLSYKEYLKLFIRFTTDNKIKEYSAKHYVISTRLHKLEAFIKIVESPDIDKIINLIKKRDTNSDNELIELLINKYQLTDIQASYIINAQLKQLSRGYCNKYKEEFAKLSKEEKMLEDKISNNNLIIQDVKDELIYIKNKYATPRISRVIKVSNNTNIPDGTFNIVITENNYIRKISVSENIVPIKGDKPKFIMNNISNLESVILFDNKGRVFKLPISKVPIIGKSDPGLDIQYIVKGLTAKIIFAMYEPSLNKLAKLKHKVYFAILSKNNALKKLDSSDFLNVPLSGIIYSKLSGSDDEICDIKIIADNMDVILYSNNKALRIPSSEIVLLKRNTIGTLGMGGSHDDMEGMGVIYNKGTHPSEYVVVITEKGKINKFLISGFQASQRNKAGSKVISLGKGDKIIHIFGCRDDNTIHLTTTSGDMDISIKDIPLSSSIGAGMPTKCYIIKAELI